ncbi:Hypothetical predicted protein [Mytilus galloprovincialis]|uniref:Apple domain-containing protein n=1 Tax=Mytilus galloprovincialis TaxID=29158 RepID=A0A8B6DH57_MYTGA|nr:Hypothetical predicted protein [Mytilus galloprovincialis]
MVFISYNFIIIEKPEADIVDIGDQSHVSCPDILRYRSADLNRGGNSNINGSTYSGTYGTFTKEEQITASSVKLESHEVTTFQDCIVLCTIHEKCNEVEFISDKICILYNSGQSTVIEQKAESKSSILTEQKLMSKG